MLGVKRAQKVWFEYQGDPRKNRELTVEKVGRRWITFVEDAYYHADRDSDAVYDRRTGDTYRRGKIWVSEDEYRKVKRLKASWLMFCHTLGSLLHRMPRGMTLERIAEARKILGMEQDPKKIEREIFDEVR